MSDNDSMLNLSRRTRLTAEVTFLMLKGAGWAALVFFGIWIAIAIIAAIGRWLPEDSRNAPDPINRSDIEMAAPLIVVV